jgi:hypothetical protein
MRVAISQQQLNAGGHSGAVRPAISRRAIGTRRGVVTAASQLAVPRMH